MRCASEHPMVRPEASGVENRPRDSLSDGTDLPLEVGAKVGLWPWTRACIGSSHGGMLEAGCGARDGVIVAETLHVPVPLQSGVNIGSLASGRLVLSSRCCDSDGHSTEPGVRDGVPVSASEPIGWPVCL